MSGDTSEGLTPLKNFMKNAFYSTVLQGIKPHVVNHGILTKLSILIHLNVF